MGFVLVRECEGGRGGVRCVIQQSVRNRQQAAASIKHTYAAPAGPDRCAVLTVVVMQPLSFTVSGPMKAVHVARSSSGVQRKCGSFLGAVLFLASASVSVPSIVCTRPSRQAWWSKRAACLLACFSTGMQGPSLLASVCGWGGGGNCAQVTVSSGVLALGDMTVRGNV